MVAAHWRAAMRSARALAISQIAVPADNVGGRTSPCDDYILVVGAVENHNLALSRRMIVGAPKEVVGELFVCGLFEAGYIDRSSPLVDQYFPCDSLSGLHKSSTPLPEIVRE